MLSIISLSLTVVSIVGILVIFTRKIAILSSIPAEGGINFALRSFLAGYKNKILSFNKEQLQAVFTRFTQKFLHRLRIWALKIENLAAKRLQKIKESEKKAGELKNGATWEELKK